MSTENSFFHTMPSPRLERTYDDEEYDEEYLTEDNLEECDEEEGNGYE